MWYRSRGSAPRPLDLPCITIEQAQRQGLLPLNSVITGNPQACIAYNLVDGHPVVVISYARFAPGTVPPDGHRPKPGELPAAAYRLNGQPYYGPIDTSWSSQRITDEISAGFVGAIMDCWDQMSPEQRDAFINDLGEDANIRERADEPQDSPAPIADDETEETTTDSPEERAARSDDPDRDPETQALYDFLKGLVCDLLAWLYDTSCDVESDPVVSMLNAAATLAAYCQHQLTDDILQKLDRCNTQPDEPPEDDEEPPEPIEPPAPIPAGGCACTYWPGWIICPNCTGDPYHCTCPGDCIPFDASSRNC